MSNWQKKSQKEFDRQWKHRETEKERDVLTARLVRIGVKSLPECYICKMTFASETVAVVVLRGNVAIGRLCPSCLGRPDWQRRAKIVECPSLVEYLDMAEREWANESN